MRNFGNCNQGMMPGVMPMPTPFYNYTESMINSNDIENIEQRLNSLESRIMRLEQITGQAQNYTNNSYNDSTYYQA